MVELHCAVEAHFEQILKLNNAEVEKTSPMDYQLLKGLIENSSFSKVLTVNGQVVGFVIALLAGREYENDNYAWFSSRFSNFLYVDRIVVDDGVSGRGLGRYIYNQLFEFARTEHIDSVVCEYNVIPENFASKKFHDSFGFKEVGTQWVANGAKKVSLQAAAT